MKEYPTLTELMQGREPGSVKVRGSTHRPDEWCRPMKRLEDGTWGVCWSDGLFNTVHDKGPWLLVSEGPLALGTLRLQMAATILAGMYASAAPQVYDEPTWAHHALAEADALIKKAGK